MRIHLQILLVWAAIGCFFSTPAYSAQSAGPQPTKHPVVLYVSNQTSKIDPVDILVTIDRNPVVNDTFHVGNGHNWHTFELELAEGTHQIHATSDMGQAFIDVVFAAHSPMWLVLNYWGKCHFQLRLSTKPVLFM